MSVMSAQSTARNAPAATPTGMTKAIATTMLGASATPSMPTDPSAHVKYTSAFRPRRSESRAAGNVVSAVVTAMTAVATLIQIAICIRQTDRSAHVEKDEVGERDCGHQNEE